MSKKILYKFPSRERPSKMFGAIENIISLSRHDNYEILLTLDMDDPTVRGEEIKARIASYRGKARAIWGTSDGKIHACNRDIEFSGEWDIVICMADDQVFIKEGFDLDILEEFKDFDGLLHFPDGFQNNNMVTLAIMSREYFSRFGWIYNPEYLSVYADNEQMDVAKILNKYKYVDKRIFEHRHSIWGFGEKDNLVIRTEDPANYARDGEIYRTRKLNNFEL